jgi:AraC-like DNA-binding protein
MRRFDEHPADTAPRPMVGEFWNDRGPQVIPWHSHRRGQIIHVARGCVTVETADGLFMLPTHRAIWLPPGTRHTVRYPGEVAFRGIYLAEGIDSGMARRATVLSINPLTRELIEAATRFEWDYPESGPEARLFAVLVDQLATLDIDPLALPDATDRALRGVTAALRAEPSDPRTLAEWAASVHMSERTFSRRFRSETGLSLAAWRQQLRLFVVLERLAAGDPVTTIAIDLGYTTPSSLTAMFTRAFGVSPSRFYDEP